MKKLLPALMFALFFVAACKKDKSVPDKTDTTTKPGSTAPARVANSPDTVTAGMSVTLSGKDLPASAADIKVSFNSVDAPVTTGSSGELIVTVPTTTSGNVKAVIGTKTIIGPAFTYVTAPKITAISPTVVSEGTVVTIKGTNLQASGLNTRVLFSGIAATINSITPTEIKAVAPKTASGAISIFLTAQISVMSAPYTYTSPALSGPYVSGDVTLTSQSDIDAFVAMNNGKQLQITGGLNISGADVKSVSGLSIITSVSGKVSFNNTEALTDAPFLSTLNKAGELSFVYTGLTSLNLNNLQGFTGGIYIYNMAKLNQLSFSRLATPAYISVYYAPLLTDMSFLSNITSAGSISLTYTGARSLTADNLTTIRSLELKNCINLSSVSMRSLANTTGTNLSGIIISQCPALATTNFSSLGTVAGELFLGDTRITDMNGFSSLVSTGSLSLIGNPELASLQGLKHLNSVTLPAITSGALYGSVTSNGISLILNPKLSSLDGLQNITTLPLLTIRDNATLNDLCPLKVQLLALNATAAYTYKYAPCCDFPIGYYRNGSRAALTLTGNGNYATQQTAIDALALCK